MDGINSNNEVLERMAIRMKIKYDKYYEKQEEINMFIFVAVVLDPRYVFRFLINMFLHFQLNSFKL